MRACTKRGPKFPWYRSRPRDKAARDDDQSFHFTRSDRAAEARQTRVADAWQWPQKRPRLRVARPEWKPTAYLVGTARNSRSKNGSLQPRMRRFAESILAMKVRSVPVELRGLHRT
jgi:hypothetical protein